MNRSPDYDSLEQKITQKEMVVRFLVSKMGDWVPGFVIVQKASSMIGKDYIIQDGDTRAHELAKVGYYDSPNFRYYIEHRKKGKYAEFRCTFKAPHESLTIPISFFDSYMKK